MTSRRAAMLGTGLIAGLFASLLPASGAAAAAAAQAQPEAELSVFSAPVSVLVNKALKPRKRAVLSLKAARLPSDATSVEATVVVTAAGRASRVSISGSTVYSAAHQTSTTTLLVPLSSASPTVTDIAGAAHVSVLLDGYDAASAATAALQSEVATLKSQVATLQSQLSSLQSTVTGVQGALASVQTTTKSLATTFSGVTRGPDPDGYDTLRFSGMNLQVVNGSGSETDLNGLGNLIVGYDDTAPYARTGSHNLIAGDSGGWSSYGGLIAGQFNDVTADFDSATGGDANVVDAAHSSVSGGFQNTAGGGEATVSGGSDNQTSGYGASISGGYRNSASEDYGSVSGGEANASNGIDSWIGGGYQQTVSGDCQGVPTVPTAGC
ncbi:MAG TPA: hypothetical protein VHU61_04145 [Solirubrobacteraceae bacterium]|jgi:hypothetical protein|nr:hypothetical protein [Solirubrobacteraceae bacterium]